MVKNVVRSHLRVDWRGHPKGWREANSPLKLSFQTLMPTKYGWHWERQLSALLKQAKSQ
ncbi:MAG: hypothetical protein ACFFBS_00685 [Promethearchaeota archaeon]